MSAAIIPPPAIADSISAARLGTGSSWMCHGLSPASRPSSETVTVVGVRSSSWKRSTVPYGRLFSAICEPIPDGNATEYDIAPTGGIVAHAHREPSARWMTIERPRTDCAP